MEFIIIRMRAYKRHTMFVHRSTPGLTCLPVWLVMSVGSSSSLLGVWIDCIMGEQSRTRWCHPA